MANNKPGKNREKHRQRALLEAAKLFLKQGYTNTTIREIASASQMSSGTLTNLFGSKEDMLAGLVSFVLEQQFSTTGILLQGVTEDKLMFYAAETVLQLHIVEMNENLREIYSMAYSLPKPSAYLQETVTGKLEVIFKEHLPDLETKDFYKLEIATGGIMRGFMTVPCNIWFTMDQKVESFLESTFRLYQVPEDKIQEAIAFVKKYDFENIAKQTIDGILQYLDKQDEEVRI